MVIIYSILRLRKSRQVIQSQNNLLHSPGFLHAHCPIHLSLHAHLESALFSNKFNLQSRGMKMGWCIYLGVEYTRDLGNILLQAYRPYIYTRVYNRNSGKRRPHFQHLRKADGNLQAPSTCGLFGYLELQNYVDKFMT